MKSFCKIVVCCLLAGTAGSSFGMEETTNLPKDVCSAAALPKFNLPGAGEKQYERKPPEKCHWPSLDDNYLKELEASKLKQ